MAAKDHASAMTDDQLISALQTVGTPLLLELVRRGYNVRLDTSGSASGVPIYVASKRPRVVGS